MSSKLFYGEIEENYNDTDFLPEKLCILGEKGKIMYISGKKRILYYPTNLTPGSNIYDAVTGSRFPYFVGKDPLFKVSVLGQHLYYETPRDFERHFKTNVHSLVKIQWQERKDRLL